MITPLDITELIDQIIDYLHDDPTSLRSCVLVARGWTPASRFHLFGKTVVTNDARHKQLFALLAENPELGWCIKSLTLHFSDVASIRTLTMTTPALSEPLVMGLSQVSKDRIQTFGGAIRGLTVVGTMHELATWNQLAEFLRAFPSLQRLSLANAYPADSCEGAEALIGMPRISVEELLLRDLVGANLETCLPMILDNQSPRIVRLRIQHPFELSMLTALCVNMGPRVEELSITLKHAAKTGPINFGTRIKMAQLSAIHITVDEGYGMSDNALLLALAYPISLYAPHLKTIKLDLRRSHFFELKLSIPDDPNWCRIYREFLEIHRGQDSDARPHIRLLFLDEHRREERVQELIACFAELERIGVVHVVFDLESAN